MMTNVPIELDNDALNHLAILIDGKQTKRTATRAEIKALGAKMFAAIRDLDPCQVRNGGVESVANAVVTDIDRGGWTLIDEPPGIA